MWFKLHSPQPTPSLPDQDAASSVRQPMKATKSADRRRVLRQSRQQLQQGHCALLPQGYPQLRSSQANPVSPRRTLGFRCQARLLLDNACFPPNQPAIIWIPYTTSVSSVGATLAVALAMWQRTGNRQGNRKGCPYITFLRPTFLVAAAPRAACAESRPTVRRRSPHRSHRSRTWRHSRPCRSDSRPRHRLPPSPAPGR